ncbi:MAG: helix-hairpin-helix domain-containing protein [Candidatus Omnitrophica bacterium]|nr:helix-hairpin-helix domain-containing protein [Candidatus Omnitrophota bacterium]
MLSLTRQERLLLVFLAITILSGVCINYALKKRPALSRFYKCSAIDKDSKHLNININNATKEELTQLPGVGEKTASIIIRYREIHGDFKEKEELKNIKGMGEKKFKKIEQYIRIE